MNNSCCRLWLFMDTNTNTHIVQCNNVDIIIKLLKSTWIKYVMVATHHHYIITSSCRIEIFYIDWIDYKYIICNVVTLSTVYSQESDTGTICCDNCIGPRQRKVAPWWSVTAATRVTWHVTMEMVDTRGRECGEMLRSRSWTDRPMTVYYHLDLYVYVG